MLIKMFKSKIHRATITECDLNYEGSLKIDGLLMDAAKIKIYEAINVWNLNSGARLMTYALRGEEGSGVFSLNGAASRTGQKGDLIIVSTFADMTEEEANNYFPTVVLVDAQNKIKKISNSSGGLEID